MTSAKRFLQLFPMVVGLVLLMQAETRAAEPLPVRGPGIAGELLRYADMPSAHVAPRNVDVWLPPGYHQGTARYPVLYAHDGQNLFDPATSYGGIDWGIDETLSRLIGEGRLDGVIVVGIWNTPRRWAEYAPQKAIDPATLARLRAQFPALADVPLAGDAYLRFLVEELKPFIDARYRTLPGRDHTAVMGSSMGGLISAYAISGYPDVFGAAACVSTHFPFGDGVAIDYLASRLPPPATHRIYFDHGTATLDAGYEPFQQRMDRAMQAAGYEQGRNWITRTYEGDEHSEKSWRVRVHVPLEFLFRK